MAVKGLTCIPRHPFEAVRTGATLTTSTEQFHTATNSQKVVTTTNPFAYIDSIWINVRPGEVYTLTAWFYRLEDGVDLRLSAYGYADRDDSKNYKGSQGNVDAVKQLDSWVSVACTVTIQPGVNWIRLSVFKLNDATAITYYIDDVTLVLTQHASSVRRRQGATEGVGPRRLVKIDKRGRMVDVR